MKKTHLLLAALIGLGGFSIGYLTGRSSGTGDTSSPAAHHTSHTTSHSPGTSHDHTRKNPRGSKTSSIPSTSNSFSRRIISMMDSGELTVNGMDIHSDSLLPGDKVKELLALTDEQFETMKQMGRDRLRAKQEHEKTLVTMLDSSGNKLIFQVAADPAFAAREKEAFTEAIHHEFGPDAAAMLRISVERAYREFEHPRHIRYTLTERTDPIPENAPPDIQKMMRNLYDFKIAINEDDEGKYMIGENSMIIPGSGSSAGSVEIHSDKQDAWVPRYHYLWEQEKGRQ